MVKYHLSSITKSISKILKPNFVCLLTNERYKIYQTGFLFGRLGHAPGVGLGGTMWGWVVQKRFCSEIQLNLVCELQLERHMQRHIFRSRPLGPLGVAKGKISLNLNFKLFKSISKIFKPNVVSFITNERYKIYSEEKV